MARYKPVDRNPRLLPLELIGRVAEALAALYAD